MKNLLLFILAALVLTGCVSTKTYEDTLEASEARQHRIDSLTADLDASRNEAAALKGERDSLASGLAALRAEREKEAAQTAARISELEASIDKLRDADAAKGQEIALLADKLATSGKEKDYLAREVDRLKIKSGEISTAKEQELANVKGTYEKLVQELKKEIEEGDIKITQAVDRLSVNLVEKILFDSGRAEIKPEGLGVLKRVGDILKKVDDRQIRVEGHTDNVRIGPRIKATYPTNWELSTARATNVVRYLQDAAGVDPVFLSAAGFSEYRPVESNSTLEGRAQNRRIEIVLLPMNVDRVLEELKK